ncbi:AMP-binding protein [Amaricoccus macauensis]|uniref:AMP-binding protein n=1 Tax=Amaricoccus macauensis TaxID=57001 RepID=UPI003C7C7861
MDAFLGRFKEVVARLPEKIAVSDDKRSLTYAEIDADSDRIARILEEDAGGENRIYAYLGRMTCECVSLNVAAGKSGTAVVALDPGHPVAAMKEVIAHSGAVRIVTTPEFGDLAREVMEVEPIMLPLDRPVRSEIDVYPIVARDPELLHFISYTSGSTGKPKGVKVSRHICDYRWKQKIVFYGTNETDVVAMFTPFWWYKHVWPLSVGAECACFDFAGKGLSAVENWLREKKVTVLLTYTAMYRQLADGAASAFPDLRQIIIGGEATRVEDVRNFDRITVPGAELMSRLACQELAILTLFVHKHGDPIDYEKVPLGRNLHPKETRLLDPDGHEVPRGTPGELVTKGEFVPPGYHNDPERTAEAFTLHPDGEWSFTMGDLAVEDENGILHALGRKDQQVKIRGYNVRPTEVEEKLVTHPDVHEAGVTAFEGAKGIRRLAAFYTVAEGAAPSSADLRGFMNDLVPGYMVPSLFIRLEAMPKTSNGKLDRKSLPAPLEVAGSGADAAATEPATETERVLMDIWRDVLGHENFGVEDDFFDMGGDSLQAMRMLLEAEKPLGFQLPYDTLFLEGADIRSIAARFDRVARGEQDDGLRVVRPGGKETVYLGYMRGGDVSSYLSTISEISDDYTFIGTAPKGGLESTRTRSLETRMEVLSAHCADKIAEHAAPGEGIRLMGYSFGAILAFDTARELTERGHTVSHLILLDAPYLWGKRYTNLRAIKRYFVGAEAMRVNLGPKRVLMTGLAALGVGSGPSDIRDASYIAASKYRPKPLPLPNVLVVRASNNPTGKHWANCWRKLVGDHMDEVEMQGSHHNIIQAPRSSVLAGILQGWLDDGTAVNPQAATPTAAE